MNLNPILKPASAGTQSLLVRALEGHDLTERQVAELYCLRGTDQKALLASADYLRRETVGDQVSYVVNRNINFTNVCVKRCRFCAFSRTQRNREGYFLPLGEVVRRAVEARDYGATEVCIQAGLAPGMEGDYYIRLCKAVHQAVPRLHIHAFSPEEILYGVRQSGWSIRDYLGALKEAGLGSLPGTSAEVLVQEVRDRISPGRITVAQWTEIIRTAHSLGIPTTSTIMYGHLETPRHIARHLLLLRDLQRQTGGLTELVPLSFVYREAPLYNDGLIPEVRAGATQGEVLNMHAVARLALNRDIPNLQVSWVKVGLEMSKRCLEAGANDLGGTLINESISTAAGASHGQLKRPSELRQAIREMGRVPVQRTTLYDTLQLFDGTEDLEIELDRLDRKETGRFGSYQQLIETDSFRFKDLGQEKEVVR
ncbi:MAG: 5-amino-6-(D-ribitylamino)uracil--L-tyrosine 4-hydroxyphenyl transferase CofH [Acidobacteriota bacterium]